MDTPTIITLVALILAIGAVIALMIVRRLNGKTNCSCGCGGCAMRDMCHSKKTPDKQEGIEEKEQLPKEEK